MSTPQISVSPNSARKETILSTLKGVVNELTGIEVDNIDVHANFIETGVDSLMLIQAVQVMQDTLGVKLSVVQLLEELTSLDLVAGYVDERLPREEEPAQTIASSPDSQPVETKPLSSAPPEMQTLATLSSAPMAENVISDVQNEQPVHSTGLEQIMAQQLQVMAQQLEMLRGRGTTVTTRETSRAPEPVTTTTTTITPPASVTPEPAGVPVTPVKQITPELFNPYQPIDPGTKGGLIPRQQQHL